MNRIRYVAMYAPEQPDPTTPVALAVALERLNAAGVAVSRSTLYRWNADRIANGLPPLFRQPGGVRGRVYVAPADVEAHVRSRCSAPAGVAA